MIAFFVNYSTVAFPPHLPTLRRQKFFGAVANSLGKNSYFPLPLDVRRCVVWRVISAKMFYCYSVFLISPGK